MVEKRGGGGGWLARNRRNRRKYQFNNSSIVRINKLFRGNEHDLEERLSIGKGGFSHWPKSLLTAGKLR